MEPRNYRILTAATSYELEDWINRAMEAGWWPQGSVSLSEAHMGSDGQTSCRLWAQSMIRRELLEDE